MIVAREVQLSDLSDSIEANAKRVPSQAQPERVPQIIAASAPAPCCIMCGVPLTCECSCNLGIKLPKCETNSTAAITTCVKFSPCMIPFFFFLFGLFLPWTIAKTSGSYVEPIVSEYHKHGLFFYEYHSTQVTSTGTLRDSGSGSVVNCAYGSNWPDEELSLDYAGVCDIFTPIVVISTFTVVLSFVAGIVGAIGWKRKSDLFRYSAAMLHMLILILASISVGMYRDDVREELNLHYFLASQKNWLVVVSSGWILFVTGLSLSGVYAMVVACPITGDDPTRPKVPESTYSPD